MSGGDWLANIEGRSAARELGIVVAAIVVLVGPAQAAKFSRCATAGRQLTGPTETRCSNGASSTTTQNPLTDSYGTTIWPGWGSKPGRSFPQATPMPRRCTIVRNPSTGALDTLCYGQ